LNFCLDLLTLVKTAFRGETFSALERITVSAACKIRKIFTLKNRPTETGSDGGQMETDSVSQLIPRALQISIADIPILTQVFSLLSLQTHNSEAAPSSAGASRRSAPGSKRLPRSQQPQATDGAPKRSTRKKHEKQASAPVLSSHDHSLPHLSLVNKDPQFPVAEQTPVFTKELSMTQDTIAQPSPVKTTTLSKMDEIDKATVECNRESNGLDGDSFDLSIYSFMSPPHSARHRKPPVDTDITMPLNKWPSLESEDELNSSRGTDGSLRGAAYDGDFYSEGEGSEEDVTEDRVCQLRMEQKEKSVRRKNDQLQILELNQTRLSDDYDWRNYESSSGSGRSSASGLPGKPLDQSFDMSIADDDGGDSLNSSEGDESYRTISVNWQPEHASAHNQLSNPREMGGMLSPPIPLQHPSDDPQSDHPGDQQEMNGRVDQATGSETDSEEELEVLYDHVLNCYYDPKTHKYYELA
jgi:hypothetical protein